MKYLFFTFFILFKTSALLLAQDYSYVHFTEKDGLGSNNVYGVTQDKEGYIFIATQNGLTRYDGKNFIIYTTKDGLTDNEVLQVYGDSKGRIWMITFNKRICYYYRGRIFNPSNDSLAAQIRTTSLAIQIIEYKQVVFIRTTTEVISINANRAKIEISNSNPKNQRNQIHLFIDYTDKFLKAYLGDSIYTYSNNCFLSKKVCKKFHHSISFIGKIMNSITNLEEQISETVAMVDTAFDRTLFLNTNNGVIQLDKWNGKAIARYLIGKKVGHSFEDAEHNLWFAVMDDGLYKLPSIYYRTFVMPKLNNSNNKEVFSVTKWNKKIYAGCSFGKMLLPHDKNKYLDFQNQLNHSFNGHSINRVTSITKISANIFLAGFDAYLMKSDHGNYSFNYSVMPVKSIEKIDENIALVSTGSSAVRVNINTLKIIDTQWTERTTCSNYCIGSYYIGTLNGLYEKNAQQKIRYFGDADKRLSKKIVSIKITQQQTIVVATADFGVFILKNGKLINNFSDTNGLSSNICKTLHLNGHYLWVGTVKGINKIDLTGKEKILHYSTSDGLPSNIINALHIADDSTVWVGSPEGLTCFKENQLNSTSICNLVIQKIQVSNSILNNDTSNIRMHYRDNNIQFEFVGISMRSGDDIIYSYFLEGLDKNWHQTKERLLSYPSLPSGSYMLKLYATNKFGISSKTKEIKFTIATPFWKTWWFQALIVLLLLAGVYFFLKRRFDKVRKIQAEEAFIKQQLADLEQRALQSQMNPHFIFNCLNSIQQFIMLDDKLTANRYLTEFASLIRNTLDNSEKKYISVAEEAMYLTQYLQLEKLRYGNQFHFSIDIDSSIEKEITPLPAMLLQPYVENSLRHGIRLKKEGIGEIKINFFERENYLFCDVEDNGIGREMSAFYKSQQHIEYQSKGMDITSKRVQLLNTESENKIEVEIADLLNETGEGIGTKVTIKIPLQKGNDFD